MSGQETGTGGVGPRTAADAGPRYDAAEIRGRMAVSFSLPALRKLAEQLGVTGVPWDRGVGEAAREVVRSFERRGQLGALVARLREERPLVEWPDPLPDPNAAAFAPPPPPVAPAPPVAATLAEQPAVDPAAEALPGDGPKAGLRWDSRPPGAPALSAGAPEGYRPEAPTLTGDEPTRDGDPDDPERTVVPSGVIEDAPAAASASAPASASASASASAAVPAFAPGSAPAPAPTRPAETSPPSAEPPIIDPYAVGSAGWPGTEQGASRAAPARGIDPRILIVVAGLMVLAVGLAFLAGRVSTPPAGAQAGAAPSASSGAAPAARRPEGLATRAADALARRVDSVARACEVEPGSPADVMRQAFTRCGPATAPTATRPPRSATSPSSPSGPSDPSGPPGADPAAPPPTAAAADPRPRSAAPPPAAPAEPSNAGCLNACERDHKACKASQCGSEPTQGSKYNAYQACLSSCLSAASRCRLTCN